VRTVSPEATVRDAARLMRAEKLGCLPVVEGGKLVGILTDHDMLKALEASAELELVSVERVSPGTAGRS
jgi:CBS domain-containing protein